MTGTKTNEMTFVFDSNNPKLLRELIAEHGESATMFAGANEDSERMLISIDTEHGITTTTYQNNGWVRVNYYDTDGFPAGETYEGRWNRE